MPLNMRSGGQHRSFDRRDNADRRRIGIRQTAHLRAQPECHFLGVLSGGNNAVGLASLGIEKVALLQAPTSSTDHRGEGEQIGAV